MLATVTQEHVALGEKFSVIAIVPTEKHVETAEKTSAFVVPLDRIALPEGARLNPPKARTVVWADMDDASDEEDLPPQPLDESHAWVAITDSPMNQSSLH